MSDITHIHSGGMVGGYSVCEARGGKLVDDADKSNCLDCIETVRAWIVQYPNHKLEAEARRACANVGIDFYTGIHTDANKPQCECH